MAYIPESVDRYSPLLKTFRINGAGGPRLIAGITFDAAGEQRAWCAECIYEHGEPDAGFVSDKQPLDIAIVSEDPTDHRRVLTCSDPSHLRATQCSKCERDIPMIGAGERAIAEDEARAEMGLRDIEDNGFEGANIQELRDSFRERFE